jgi:hypothetical protein
MSGGKGSERSSWVGNNNLGCAILATIMLGGIFFNQKDFSEDFCSQSSVLQHNYYFMYVQRL